MTETQNLKLPCVYTVETAGVMAIVLFCMVTVIMFAYEKRDEIVSKMILQETAHNESHIEATWLGEESNTAKVEELAGEQLSVIPGLSGMDVNANRDGDEARAVSESISGKTDYGMNISSTVSKSDSENTIVEKIYDPETYMRESTVIEKLFSDADK